MAAPQEGTLKVLLGYSRFLQAMLSLSQPAIGAILCAQGFPSVRIIIIGILAAIAGNLSVFSLNDLLDVEVDKKRFSHLKQAPGFDIDSAFMRHPLAQGYLSKTMAIGWTGSMGVIALMLAYVLNPLCSALFIVSVSLEILYCKMARISHWKFVVSGFMVAFGAVAGWVAVGREIAWIPLGIFFLWMIGWEIGGRNIVNDWSDVEEDRHLGIKTVPLTYGFRAAGRLALVFLLLGFVASLGIAPFVGLDLVFVVCSFLAGAFLLLQPAGVLIQTGTPESALALFNKASLYPPVMLVIVVASYYYRSVF